VTEDGEIEELYSFIESQIAGAIFLYACVDSFTNWLIGHEGKDVLKLNIKGTVKDLSVAKIENDFTTVEKLSLILPQVVSVKSPKSKAAWHTFKDIEKIRHGTVHFKKEEQYLKDGKNLDQNSVYHRVLKTDCKKMYKDTIQLMKHFFPSNKYPRWLKYAPKL